MPSDRLAGHGASPLAGMVMIGLTTFLPVYVQGVMQKSALTAGFALSVMVLGWPMGATLAARAVVDHAFRHSSGNARRQPAGAVIGTLVFFALQLDHSAGIRRNRLHGSSVSVRVN